MKPVVSVVKWLIAVAGPFTGFAIWVNATHPHMPVTQDEWWAFSWQSVAWIGAGAVVAKGANKGIDNSQKVGKG